MTKSSGSVPASVGSIVLIILFVLVIVSTGLAVYFYRQASELKKDPQRVASEEVQEIVFRVGQIMVLPEGEEPTLATVTEPERLQDQPFFAKAKVGDKVLLYANAKKAILYDPATNKIVEVAPLNIDGSPDAGEQTTAPPAPTDEMAVVSPTEEPGDSAADEFSSSDDDEPPAPLTE